MDWNMVKGNWKQLRKEFSQKWDRLTDKDLDEISGKRETLAGKIQKYYGCAKKDAEQRADEFVTGLKSGESKAQGRGERSEHGEHKHS